MRTKVTQRRKGSGVAFRYAWGGSRRVPDKRTIRVLGALVVGMTIISSILLALEPDPTHRGAVVSLSAVDFQDNSGSLEQLWPAAGVQDWRYIVIHDSFGEAGSEKDLNRAWDSWYAQQGLAKKGHGYHFVINDEQGLDDGLIQITPRWLDQRVGDFIDAEGADNWNRISVGICVMGDADAGPFSTRQNDSLVALVKELQQKLGIPRENVIVHVGNTPDRPSTYFNTAEFRRRIAD